MASFGGAREKCWVCSKSIYPADPQYMFNGKVHRGCAKCSDCGTSLNPANMFSCKDDKGNPTIVCATHNQVRLRNPTTLRAPTVSAPVSIMTEAMRKALEKPSPSPSSKTKKVSDAVADIDAKGVAIADAKKAAEHPMQHLVTDLKEGDEGDKLRTFWEISNMAKDEEQVKTLADPKLGLLQTMAKIILEDDGESRSAAVGVLWNLSVAPENRMNIIQPQIGLLAALTSVLNCGQVDTINRALGVIHNVTLTAEAQEVVGKHTPLLAALVNILHGSDAIGSDRAAGALWNLATCSSNRPLMMAVPDLVSSLSGLLLAPPIKNGKTEDGEGSSTDISSKALIVIYYLTLCTENRASMGMVEGLLPTLVACLKEGDAETNVKVCGIFVNLSSTTENKTLLAAESLGLIDELVHRLSPDCPTDLRSKACGCLWNLSVAGGNRSVMSFPQHGLIPALVVLLQCQHAEGAVEDSVLETATKCCVIAQNLAGDKTCHENLLVPCPDSEVGLVGALVRTVLWTTGDARLKAFGAMVNLSLSDVAQAALGKEEGTFEALMSVLGDTTAGDNRARACGVMQNLSVNADNRKEIVATEGLLNLLVSLMVAGDEVNAEGKKLCMGALSLCLNLSVAPENKAVLGATTGLAPALTAIIDHGNTDEQVKACSLVWSLAAAAENREAFSEHTDLIVALTAAAARGGDIRVKATGALSNLAPGVKL